jgi:hypothetical protein
MILLLVTLDFTLVGISQKRQEKILHSVATSKVRFVHILEDGTATVANTAEIPPVVLYDVFASPSLAISPCSHLLRAHGSTR